MLGPDFGQKAVRCSNHVDLSEVRTSLSSKTRALIRFQVLVVEELLEEGHRGGVVRRLWSTSGASGFGEVDNVHSSVETCSTGLETRHSPGRWLTVADNVNCECF